MAEVSRNIINMEGKKLCAKKPLTTSILKSSDKLLSDELHATTRCSSGLSSNMSWLTSLCIVWNTEVGKVREKVREVFNIYALD